MGGNQSKFMVPFKVEVVMILGGCTCAQHRGGQVTCACDATVDPKTRGEDLVACISYDAISGSPLEALLMPDVIEAVTWPVGTSVLDDVPVPVPSGPGALERIWGTPKARGYEVCRVAVRRLPFVGPALVACEWFGATVESHEDLPNLLIACASCGAMLEKRVRRICMGCRHVRYCNAECQVTHWPLHKATCRNERRP